MYKTCMRILITGPVAVGKSSIAKIIAKELGLPLITLKDFVNEHNLIEYHEKEWDSNIVDIKKLQKALELNLPKNCVVEGHLLVDFHISGSMLFVLNSGAKLLYDRMIDRGYSDKKIEENLLAYHLDYFEINAKKYYDKPIFIENKNINKTKNRIISEVRRRENMKSV